MSHWADTAHMTIKVQEVSVPHMSPKKKPHMLCEVPPQQIKMHNHNVVKDEIKS